MNTLEPVLGTTVDVHGTLWLQVQVTHLYIPFKRRAMLSRAFSVLNPFEINKVLLQTQSVNTECRPRLSAPRSHENSSYSCA
jgi:hypothetical protein